MLRTHSMWQSCNLCAPTGLQAMGMKIGRHTGPGSHATLPSSYTGSEGAIAGDSRCCRPGGCTGNSRDGGNTAQGQAGLQNKAPGVQEVPARARVTFPPRPETPAGPQHSWEHRPCPHGARQQGRPSPQRLARPRLHQYSAALRSPSFVLQR